MKNTLFALSIIVLVLSCKRNAAPTATTTADPLKDSLTHQLTNIHKQGQINGFAVAIVTQDSIVYKAGIGYANTKTKEAYTSTTIQNIGSVSKTFIGIALLKAQEMGKLDLDDPINNYLPYTVVNPNHPNKTITIRHLATHTSTIVDTDYYDNKAYVLKEGEPALDLESVDEQFNAPDTKLPLLDFLGKIVVADGEWYLEAGFLKQQPGERYEYSNIGATLAAAILEVAVGQSFNEFTKAHILDPLRMNASGWSFSDIDLEKHSKLYANPQDELPFYALITYPDGGLITSISDLGLYLTELIKGHSGEGTLLNREGYRELFKEQLAAENFMERDEENAFDDEYNTGIFMGFTPGDYIGHTGGDPGIATFMFFDPKTQTGRILMINTSIVNREGVDEFYAIWNTLGEYEDRLN